MSDPILDEIQRTRAMLLKSHVGIDGYLKYVQQLEKDRLQKERTIAAKKRPTKKNKPSL
jgi:hypothetical protein